MKSLGCLFLLAGMLHCAPARAREYPDTTASAPAIGVELRGDTLIYRTVGRRGLVEDPDGRRYRLKPQKGSFGPRHAVTLEVGAYPLCGSRPIFFIGGYDETLHGGYPGTFPGEQRYYRGPVRTSGAISLGYAYRVRRWLDVGVTFSYAGFYCNVRNTARGDVAWREREHYLTVMPVVRVGWLNRPAVRLYSSFQLGYQRSFETYYPGERWDENYCGVQLTLLGISVGRRFFGYAELGIGMRGVCICGVGYRFGNKKEQQR